MHMSETRTIAAPRDVVWAAILDRAVLAASVPGCTAMEGDAETGFQATVTQKVGPVKATFKGQVTLEDQDPPSTVRLVGEGKGGAAGFAKGSAVVRLADAEDGATALSYEVDAKVGGKLAQLGSRVIDGFARRMADQFFDNLQAAVEAPPAEADAPEEIETQDGAPAKKGWFRRMLS